MSKQIKKRQHYVPQFYLNQFAFKVKRNNFFVNHYDKVLGMSFTDNVKNVAEEHKFYDVKAKSLEEKYGLSVPDDFDEQELENKFAFFEGEWSIVIKAITERYLKSNGIFPMPFLTTEEKSSLSRFIALQAIRTPSFRDRANRLANFLSKNLDEKFASVFEEMEYDELNFYLHIHSGVIDRLAENILENFNWITAFSEKRLITSDNPLSQVFHLRHSNQYDGVNWPKPPYFEEYSIALNPNVLLILAQKDNKGFESLIPSEDFFLNDRLHRRYTRHHIINSSRKIIYFDKEQLNYVKGMMFRMSQRKEDFLDNSKFIVSAP